MSVEYFRKTAQNDVESDIRQHVDVDALDYKLRRCDFSAQINCSTIILYLYLSFVDIITDACMRSVASLHNLNNL